MELLLFTAGVNTVAVLEDQPMTNRYSTEEA
jgi:hypothetical protein